MTQRSLTLFLAGLFLPGWLASQTVDRSKYPDYSDKLKPDASLLAPTAKGTRVATTRPDHVNNAETIYFPPVFN